MTEVRVNRRAAGRIESGHPWVFASDIEERCGASPGATVKVVDPKGRALGAAHHSSTSQIALRMLSRQVLETGRDFFLSRLRATKSLTSLAEPHRHSTKSWPTTLK